MDFIEDGLDYIVLGSCVIAQFTLSAKLSKVTYIN